MQVYAETRRQILPRREFLQKLDLLCRSWCDEDAEVVRSRIGRMHEEALAFAFVSERRAEQDLAVVERDGDLAALRCRAELLAIDAHLIAGEIADEEECLEFRQMQEQHVARVRLRRQMQLRLG